MRAIAESAYRHGAKFVDVAVVRPVGQARADRARARRHARLRAAVVRRAHPRARRRTAPRGSRCRGRRRPACSRTSTRCAPAATGCRRVKESGKVVNDRTTNWSIVPCPTPAWAKLVFPDLDERGGAGHARRAESCTCCGSTSPIRSPPGASAPTTLVSIAAPADRARLRRAPLRGPGHRPDDRAAARRAAGRRRASRPSTASSTCRTSRPRRCSPRPTRSAPTATSPPPSRSCWSTAPSCATCACASRAAARCRSTPTPRRRRCARSSSTTSGAARLGEVALVDAEGRIGKLDTVFYDTLLDENAASHIALGQGFPFLVDGRRPRPLNESQIHIDFMIGSPDMAVTGITADGDRVPVLVQGHWQI